MIYLLLIIELLTGCPWNTTPVNGICIDKYEAPNTYGAKPWVMQSALDAQEKCQSWGKRLCHEAEWEDACRLTSEPCNNDKRWMKWDRKTANSTSEITRLWQGIPSGSMETCRTPNGVYDLTGNVEEWVISGKDTRGKDRDWPFTLKGGWWAKITPCHKSNDAHEPTFRFYQTGFRCCKDQHALLKQILGVAQPG
jgi:sulfatase modifying factor 1